MPDSNDSFRPTWESLLSGRIRPHRPTITPDEARALIDQVLRNHGIDPNLATDKYGMRRVKLGDAYGRVGIIPWNEEDYYFLAFVPILPFDDAVYQNSEFLAVLLSLNHMETGAARFTIQNGVVYLSLVRPIRGLDAVEVDDAIHTVLVTADRFGPMLRAAVVYMEPEVEDVDFPLPKIALTMEEWDVVRAVLLACDAHARDIFSGLLERWQKAGLVIRTGSGGLGLHFMLEEKMESIGAMRPGGDRHPARIILGWESLRRRGIFPEAAIDAFQDAVDDLNLLKITESSAHLAVTEAFDKAQLKQLLGALQALIATARPAPPVPEPAWPADFPPLRAELGKKTLERTIETLKSCSPEARQIFIRLINGWSAAGGPVHCNRVGRIYLKHPTAKSNLLALAAPSSNRGERIAVSLAQRHGDDRFRKLVESLPGYSLEGVVDRLTLEKGFGAAEAEELLADMIGIYLET